MAIFFIIIPQITSLPSGVPSTLYSRLIISLRKEEILNFQLLECRMRRYRALSGLDALISQTAVGPALHDYRCAPFADNPLRFHLFDNTRCTVITMRN